MFLEYEKSEDGVTITDVKGKLTQFRIPAKIDGLPVTTIGEEAFSGCKSLTINGLRGSAAEKYA